MKRWIVFTDLDGTLLDAQNYSFSAAGKALHYLKDTGIPIIPCTSKTHLEVLEIRKQLQIDDPFIVENGSAVFFTKQYFQTADLNLIHFDSYDALILGKTYKEILALLNKIKMKYRIALTGFNEMNIEQIQSLTDLNIEDSRLAKQRFFSEPFVLNKESDLPEEAKREIQKNYFRLLRGNRFFHLLGDSDKGKAASTLMRLYRKKIPNDHLVSIGIGDSMNDLEMLKVVDFPVLVKKHIGKHQSGINLNNMIYTEGIGPAGWQEAIFKILKTY